MKTLNNTVIKNLSPEMGKKILEKYKADGWDTKANNGSSFESKGNKYIYYGVIDNVFSCHSLEEVQEANAKIIELEELPKRGDEVLVWDNNESKAKKRIFLTYIEGSKYPFVTVCSGDEEMFKSGKLFRTSEYKHFKPINTELEELRKRYEELGKQIEKLERR